MASATAPSDNLSPADQRRVNELVATVALVFSLSDDEIDQLAEAIYAARITSLSAAYDEAARIVDADADPYAPDDSDDEDQRGAAATSAAGIANTYHNDLANQIAQQVAQMAPGLLEHGGTGAAEGTLATGVASWATRRAEWKARQIANAEAGAGAEAGTTRAVDDMLSGDLLGNLDAMGLGPDDVLVAILPDYSSPDGICGEFAGQTFPLDMYYDLPDYPAHANCIHEKVILLRGQELDDVDPEGLTREEVETEAQLAEQARLDAMTTATQETSGDEERIVAEQTRREGPSALLNLVGPTPEAGQLRNFDLRLPDAKELERLAKQQESLFGRGFGAQAQATKAHVVKAISQRLEGNVAWAHAVEALGAKDSEALTNRLVKQWAVGGTGPLIVAMQQAVRDEFSLADAAMTYTKAQIKSAERKFGDDEIRGAFRAFARAMYENTQAWLDEHGIEEVVMYRGMVWPEGKAPPGLHFFETVDRVNVSLQPISSFAGNLDEARNFARMDEAGNALVIAVRVPRERILSSALAGIGAKSELEYTVLGGTEEVWGYGEPTINEHGQRSFINVRYADFSAEAEAEREYSGEVVEPVALELKRPGIDARDVRDLSPDALGHLSDLQRMTTSKQVLAWMRDEFWQSGIDLPATVDVKTLKEIGAELVRLRDLFPGAFRDLDYISISSRPTAKNYLKALMPETKGKPPAGWVGGTFRLKDAGDVPGPRTAREFGAGMIFDARLMTDRAAYDAFADNAVRTGFWQDGARDAGYVLRHEFGHVLQAVLRGDADVTPLARNAVKDAALVKKSYTTLMRDAGEYLGGLRGFPAVDLSDYAKASADELFAEGVAALRYGSETAQAQEYTQRLAAVLDAAKGIPGATERIAELEALHADAVLASAASAPLAPSALSTEEAAARLATTSAPDVGADGYSAERLRQVAGDWGAVLAQTAENEGQTTAEHVRMVKALSERLKGNKSWQAFVRRSDMEGYEAAGLPEYGIAGYAFTASDQLVDAIISDWGDDASVVIHLAVREEFGLTGGRLTSDEELLAEAKQVMKRDGKAFRAFVRAMYDETQAWFADRDISEVVLYRGRKWGVGAQPDGVAWDLSAARREASLAPVASFSTEPDTALMFTRTWGASDYRMLIAERVPTNEILSLPLTGLGRRDEQEMLVLGGKARPVWSVAWTKADERAATLDALVNKLAEASRTDAGAAEDAARVSVTATDSPEASPKIQNLAGPPGEGDAGAEQAQPVPRFATAEEGIAFIEAGTGENFGWMRAADLDLRQVQDVADALLAAPGQPVAQGGPLAAAPSPRPPLRTVDQVISHPVDPASVTPEPPLTLAEADYRAAPRDGRPADIAGTSVVRRTFTAEDGQTYFEVNRSPWVAPVEQQARQLAALVGVPQLVQPVELFPAGREFNAVTRYLPNAQPLGYLDDPEQAYARLPQETRERALLFEYLLADGDPNLGNVLLNDDGRVIRLDFEQGFLPTTRLRMQGEALYDVMFPARIGTREITLHAATVRAVLTNAEAIRAIRPTDSYLAARLRILEQAFGAADAADMTPFEFAEVAKRTTSTAGGGGGAVGPA